MAVNKDTQEQYLEMKYIIMKTSCDEITGFKVKHRQENKTVTMDYQV